MSAVPSASDARAPRASGHVFVAASLDGFIARPDGSVDWLEVPGAEAEDHGYDAFMAGIDGLLMGAETFRTVLGFSGPDLGAWPYAKPVRVISRSLRPADLPAALAGRVELLPLPPREALEAVAAEGWRRAYVDGGRLVQAFLAEGLIEDLVLTRIPVLLGAGRPLLGPGAEVRLEHLGTRAFPSGLVQSRWRVAR
ncbi:dihydrofolate reductase family protein [Albimonas sp. CAU 1670]|uniref:dihydrofolate reductase family protein n=1 Tax=Albimonas sp. CAU 1670 TaxID=3032599 RepID=UPI0023DAD34B|nr:dihydrofolate reductase family protein [Albimonas sp. CAU 1670]MDF2234271.1 dihydrofolate reductase family protein [Albimonas sp. CAU 1670]